MFTKIRFKLLGLVLLGVLATLAICFFFVNPTLIYMYLTVPAAFIVAIGYIVGLVLDHVIEKRNLLQPGYSALANKAILRKGWGGLIIGLVCFGITYAWYLSGAGESPVVLVMPFIPVCLMILGLLVGICTLPRKAPAAPAAEAGI